MALVSNEKDSIKDSTRKYHHGNLRSVLLEAAEAELIEKGPDKFSLRGVAKRAGVSHAAPAHHFGDVNTLLTELTAISFQRFDAAMRNHSDKVGADPIEKLIAIGIGYINYAKNNSAMFDMQFNSSRIDRCSSVMKSSASLSYYCLTEHMQAALEHKGKSLEQHPDVHNAYWALAHGLAALFTDKSSENMPPSQRENLDERFIGILRDFAQKL